MRRTAIVATLFLLSTYTPYAIAQPSAQPSAGGSKEPSDPKKMEEARQRFARGLQLYDEKNYEAARVELERAYQLAPTWKLLYNIGLCYGQRGDYVEAIKDLERYLKDGGAEISKDRVDEVNKELANLRPRIAHVRVQVNVPDADIQLDDQSVGKAPLPEPLMINPGRRKISAIKPGYFPSNQVITAAGSDDLSVNIELKELPKASYEKNPYVGITIVSWGVTAAGVIGGGALAFFASQAADDLKNKRQQIDVTRDELDKAARKTKTLALAADITFGVSAAVAVVATYFTVKLIGFKPGEGGEKEKPKEPGKIEVGFGLWPGGGALNGAF
jgi:Tfp pilus assembly protein PilF